MLAAINKAVYVYIRAHSLCRPTCTAQFTMRWRVCVKVLITLHTCVFTCYLVANNNNGLFWLSVILTTDCTVVGRFKINFILSKNFIGSALLQWVSRKPKTRIFFPWLWCLVYGPRTIYAPYKTQIVIIEVVCAWYTSLFVSL